MSTGEKEGKKIRPLTVGRKMRRLRRILRLFLTDSYRDVWLESDEEVFGSQMEKLEEFLHDLNDDNYNRELLLVQSRMSALQSQINPHFLYNTLDVIRSYALKRNVREVAEMAEALSTMFRYNIGKPDAMATLDEELDNVRNYFLIQKYRFGDKFSLSVEMEPGEDFTQYLLPRLSIQPLVENAIHHGLEDKIGPGLVRIRIFRSQRKLYIRVSDNGKGMDRETLLSMRRQLEQGVSLPIEPRKKGKAGIAILNLNQRVKLAFGEEYGLDVTSIEQTGTIFTLCVPLASGNGGVTYAAGNSGSSES